MCVVYKTLGDIGKNSWNATTEFKHPKGQQVEREVDFCLS